MDAYDARMNVDVSAPVIAPSLLAVWDKSGGDESAVVAAAMAAVASGADWLHIDVMDGVFVPARAFSVECVKRLRSAVEVPLDVHLMTLAPEDLISAYLFAGADRLVFHPTATADVARCLDILDEAGIPGGLALDITEDISLLAPWQGCVQQVLAMTVKAGAGGQPFMASELERISHIRTLVGPHVAIVADGGIGAAHAPSTVQAGADVLVAGSAVFNAPDMEAAIRSLKGPFLP